MIEKLQLLTHVTALRSVEPHFLLEGCGGFLNLYDIQSNRLLESLDLFKGSRIHGIFTLDSHNDAIVFGGKHIAIVNFTVKDQHDNRLRVVHKWEESDWIKDAKFTDEGRYIVMLTAHNKVITQNVDSKSDRREIQSSEQCILYCGEILGTDHTELVILSGTVFGEILVWSPDQNNILFHRLSGHNGVIFSVHYDRLSNTIISTSDDRTVRTWNIQHSDIKTSSIVPGYELYGHEARVWNSVVIRTAAGMTLIATLGEDSKICLWDLTTGRLVSKLDSAHPGSSVWTADWNAHLNILITGGGDGATRIWTSNQLEELHSLKLELPVDGQQVPRLVAILEDRSYLTLTHQGVLYTRNPDSEAWIQLFHDERLSKGSVMDSKGSHVVFGTQKGTLFVFYGPKLELKGIHQLEGSKIYSVLLISDGQQLLICFDKGRMELRDSINVEIKDRFQLPDGKQRWPECALSAGVALLVGDRDGSLHLYHSNHKDPLQSFPNIHGKNGLTDIRADPESKDLYYTSGKDGRVGLWRLNEDQSRLELLSVTNTSLGWIARLSWIKEELIYLAFHSDRFVVWSSQQQRSLLQIGCGGGHRSWDFSTSSASVTFLFIKDRIIYEIRRPIDSVFHPTLPGRCGGHSRSICTAKFISNQLILTGSEDTTIKLSKMTDHSFQTLNTIPKHVSSVRALAVKQIKSDPSNWLCVSAGGRAQLAVGLLTNDGQIYKDVKSHFLSGWLHRSSRKPWTEDLQVIVPDPETRFMDLDILDRGEGLFHIFSACSDGHIRLHELDINRKQLELILEQDFHSCCVLRVKIVENQGRSLLISTGTDGRLAIWDAAAGSMTEPMGFLALHQSGINSLDCRWVSPGKLLLLTGGDDNALILTHLDVDRVGTSSSAVIGQKLSAHSSQISGVAFLDRDLAVSVSLDQRLIVWRVTEGDSPSLDWLSTTCCDVSDIQGLHVLNERLIVVYGQGMQILRLP